MYVKKLLNVVFALISKEKKKHQSLTKGRNFKKDA